MRIPSGKTDQVIYFVAVDSADLKTRETGLSSFTVYRSRNGGAATAYTTPTVSEISAANMPGVYSLLIDEDTTIAAGSDSEEYVVHITQAAMAPVTRTIELYRRDTTSGQTITVSSNVASANTVAWNGAAVATPTVAGVPEVDITHIAGAAVNTASAQLGVNVVNAAGTAWNSGAIGASTLAADTITAAKIAADAIGASELAADAVTEIQSGLATSANQSTIIGFIDTEVAAILAAVDTEVAAIKAKTDSLTFTVAGVVDANVTHQEGGTDVAAAIRSAVGLASANLDTQLDALPTAAENATAATTTAMAEAYSTDGGTVTLAQGIYELLARDQEISISGTTMTVKKRDGTTTAYTLTLNDATSPTAVTRSG